MPRSATKPVKLTFALSRTSLRAVDRRCNELGCDRSTYLTRLIRADLQQAQAARKHLEGLLAEGLPSVSAHPLTPAFWDRLRADIRKRSQKFRADYAEYLRTGKL